MRKRSPSSARSCSRADRRNWGGVTRLGIADQGEDVASSITLGMKGCKSVQDILLCDELPRERGALRDRLDRLMAEPTISGVSLVISLGPDRWVASRRARRATVTVRSVHAEAAGYTPRCALITGLLRYCRYIWRAQGESHVQTATSPPRAPLPVALVGLVPSGTAVRGRTEFVRRADGSLATRARFSDSGVHVQTDFVASDGLVYLSVPQQGSDEGQFALSFDHENRRVRRIGTGQSGWEASQVMAILAQHDVRIIPWGPRAVNIAEVVGLPVLGLEVNK